MAAKVIDWRTNILSNAFKNFQTYVVNETLRELRDVERNLKSQRAAVAGGDAKLQRQVIAADLVKLQDIRAKTEMLGKQSEQNFEAQLEGAATLAIGSVVGMTIGPQPAGKRRANKASGKKK